MAGTTENTSATSSGTSGVAEAAEAWQDVLTPGRRKARDTEDAESNQAPQGKKPTAKRAAEPAPEDDDTDDEGEEPKAEGEDETGDEGEDDEQGDKPEEGESEEDESESEEDVEGDSEVDLTQEYTVTLADGTEASVTLEELVKGYHRQSDYTRKTQAVAEERKAVQGERQQVSAMRAQYAQGLEQLQEAIKSVTPQEPDWEALKATDPLRYAEEWADWQRRQHVVAQIEEERRAVQEQQRAEFEAHRQEAVRSGREWLLQQIPEWKDEGRAKAERAAMRSYAEKLGFTAEELKAVDDPRAVLLIRQATLYAKLQEKKPTLIKPKSKTPVTAGTKTPVMKPLAVKQPQSKKAGELSDAKKRHGREKSVQSAARFFQTLL